MARTVALMRKYFHIFDYYVKKTKRGWNGLMNVELIHTVSIITKSK